MRIKLSINIHEKKNIVKFQEKTDNKEYKVGYNLQLIFEDRKEHSKVSWKDIKYILRREKDFM